MAAFAAKALLKQVSKMSFLRLNISEELNRMLYGNSGKGIQQRFLIALPVRSCSFNLVWVWSLAPKKEGDDSSSDHS